MTKKLSVILFAILFSVSLNAQNKMSAYTRLMLKAYYQAEQTNAQSLKSNRLLSVFSNSENNKVIAKAIIELNDEYQLPADELAELEVELNRGDEEKSTAEFGDFLFSLINAGRLYHLNPENALEYTNQKFIRRFNYVEEQTLKQGRQLADMTLAEMDRLWQEAKEKLG